MKLLKTHLAVLFVFLLFFTTNKPATAGWEWQNPLPTGNRFNGIWGSSGNDVFAVGYNGTILHYDGSTWSEMEGGTTHLLNGIWGSSATDIFAAGNYGTIIHYNGNTWSEMDSGMTHLLNGIWGSSPTDIFVVGNDIDYHGTILHYDGTTWSPMSSGMTERFDDVWGSSSTDVFVVGRSTILHYDGSAWSEMEGGRGNAIWGSSAADVFAVGFHGTIPHYDGNTWSEMDTPPSPWKRYFWSIWGSSATDVFAVGTGGTILHYDGDEDEQTSCTIEKIFGENSKEIELLRSFRDEVLSKTPEGLELIRLYYQWSPVIVKAMVEDEEFKEKVKEMIEGVLELITE